jgi:hypothetical protein
VPSTSREPSPAARANRAGAAAYRSVQARASAPSMAAAVRRSTGVVSIAAVPRGSAHALAWMAARLRPMTCIVRPYSAVGLNSTISVPDVMIGMWPGGA